MVRVFPEERVLGAELRALPFKPRAESGGDSGETTPTSPRLSFEHPPEHVSVDVEDIGSGWRETDAARKMLQYWASEDSADPSFRNHAEAMLKASPFARTPLRVGEQPNSLPAMREMPEASADQSTRIIVFAARAPTSLRLEDDLLSFCGARSQALWVTRQRWRFVALAFVGVVLPELLQFVFADCAFGEFVIAYPSPLWLDTWKSVGYSVGVVLLCLCYSALQRQLLSRVFWMPSTFWILTVSLLLVACEVSLLSFGIGKPLYLTLPVYVGHALFFPLIAMGDALPHSLRLVVLRFFGPAAVSVLACLAIWLQLPAAARAPGSFALTVMGVETLTNLNCLSKAATVLLILVAKGVVRSWLYPDQLSFLRSAIMTRQGAESASMLGGSSPDRVYVSQPRGPSVDVSPSRGACFASVSPTHQ